MQRHPHVEPPAPMPAAGLNEPAYRPDIDGLRAVAVLAVLAYHGFPDAVRGGFAGVDVFFVISGFLISTLLLGRLQQHDFSFREFYARRARRLLPALAIVLAACAVAGWFLLDPDDYRNLGRHGVGSALFVPNLLLWREAGYFDIASELKPLLHLWSLGVEEQFYFVWPLLLWAAWRIRLPMLATMLVIALGSFVASEVLLRSDPSGAFYLPHTRFWELLLGAALAQIGIARGRTGAAMPRRHAESCAWIGLALVLGSCLGLHAELPFPGRWAMPPTIGACLLIAAGRDTWVARMLLSNRLAVFIGRISYPLYLWHWPLLSMSRLAAPEMSSPALRLVLLSISFVLAWITWRFLETPVRSGQARTWKVMVPATGLAAATLACAVIVRSNGFESRVDIDVRRYADYTYDAELGARAGTCWLGAHHAPDAFAEDCVDPAQGHGKPLVVIWGDSHAARLAVGLRAIAGDRFGVAQFTRDGCPPIFALKYPRCPQSNLAVLQRIGNLRPEYLVLFSFWATPTLPDRNALLDEIDRTIAHVAMTGSGRVVIVGPSAQWDGAERTLPKNLLRLYQRKPYLRAPARTRFGVNPLAQSLDAQFAARFSGRDDVTYFSAHDALCNERGCMTRAGDDPYDLMTWDYGHLTASGAEFVAHALEAAVGGFSQVLARGSTAQGRAVSGLHPVGKDAENHSQSSSKPLR